MTRVLMPVPLRDFDPTEVAIPWKILRENGVDVIFATSNGAKAQCDPLMISGRGLGPLGFFLRARRDAREAYAELEASPEFRHPQGWDAVRTEDFDGIVLSGGHAKGMREILESTVVQTIARRFFELEKPVGAICHGVVILARAKTAAGESVIRNRRVTALLESQELSAWRLTRAFAGDYYRTYPQTVQSEVTTAIGSPTFFVSSRTPLLRDAREHLNRGLTVRDGNLLTARWPGDAYSFAQGFLGMLGGGAGMRFQEPAEFVDQLNQIFCEVRNRVLHALPDSDVDHIGSSAIEGTISKGDLDILVRVGKERFEESIAAVEQLGFQIKEGTLRTESLCMLVTTEFGKDVAIQLVARGTEFEDFLQFRDKLNGDPNLVREYNQLKRDSVGLDPARYREKKSAFIERVLGADDDAG